MLAGNLLDFEYHSLNTDSLNTDFYISEILYSCKLSFFHGENRIYAKQIEIHSTIQHFVVFLLIYALFKSERFPENICSTCLPMLEKLVPYRPL